MSKSVTISSIGSIESISFWLSISITLSISIPGIAKTIPMAIAKRRVSKMTISMTKRINTVSKTISSIRMVESISITISISVSLPLGNMDNISRVGNISASTSIGTMDSRDSSRSNTMDTYSVGNIGDTISMVDRDSMDSMVDRGNMMSSIANMSYTIAKMMPSNAIQSISISSSKSCSTSQQSYPDHVVWRMILLESPC